MRANLRINKMFRLVNFVETSSCKIKVGSCDGACNNENGAFFLTISHILVERGSVSVSTVI